MSLEEETTTTIMEPPSLPESPPETSPPPSPSPPTVSRETPPEGPCPICHTLPETGTPFTPRGWKHHLRIKHPGVGGDTTLRIGVGERRPPAPTPPPEAVEEIPDFTPITADQVAAIMASQGLVTNQVLAPGTTAWLWTQDEVNLIAPAAARMVNRSKAAAAISNASDPIAVLTGSAAYVVRNVQQGGLPRARAARAPSPARFNREPVPGGEGAAAGDQGAPADFEPAGESAGIDGTDNGRGPAIPDVGPRTGLWPVG